jgi:hypothetical protein
MLIEKSFPCMMMMMVFSPMKLPIDEVDHSQPDPKSDDDCPISSSSFMKWEITIHRLHYILSTGRSIFMRPANQQICVVAVMAYALLGCHSDIVSHNLMVTESQLKPLLHQS